MLHAMKWLGLVCAISSCNSGDSSADAAVRDLTPAVTLAASQTLVQTPSTVTLVAAAVDDSAIARVEFLEGSTKLGEATLPPYAQPVAFTAADNGSHRYTARAVDPGGKAATSAAVTITVEIGGAGGGSGTGGGAGGGGGARDNVEPTVALIASANTLTAAGSVDFTATATDDVGVVKVELWDGLTKVAETNAPVPNTNTYRFTRSFAQAENGTHRFFARAYDAAVNARASSPLLTINVNIQAPSDIKDIVGCPSTALLIKNDGTVAYAGNGLGGASPASSLFVPVFGLAEVTAIGCNAFTSLALYLKADGTVLCQGDNQSYGCASTTPSVVATPSPIAGVGGATHVSSGGGSCVRKDDGTALCWAGYQTAAPSHTPQPLRQDDGGVFSGVSDLYGCPGNGFARNADGSLWGWGRNDGTYGLGGGFQSFYAQATPVPVVSGNSQPLAGVVKLACGNNHRVVLLGDGGVMAFGVNTAAGELGNATAPPGGFNFAIPTVGLGATIDLACGARHTLALNADGTVWAFGENVYGQLGNGAANAGGPAPVQVVGLSNIVKVGAAGTSSFALRNDGALFAWGSASTSGVDDAGTTITSPHRVLGPGL